MADAGINDISKRSNINKVLDVMLSKFRLDLTDEQGNAISSFIIILLLLLLLLLLS